jgi:hypothetical protein
MALQRLEEHLERALQYLPAAFSQLAFLASVRDTYTGRYLHEGWYSIASQEEVHHLLRHTHQQVFEQVLDLPLAELCRELSEYFRSAAEAGTEEEAARVWLELESYREMIPQGCSPLDRGLFLSQVGAALGMLVIAREPPLPGEQSAWPHPRPDPRLLRHRDN